MDVASLASRLNGLELSQAGSKDVGARLSSFFFTPKTGSKHPDDNSKDLKVVVACLEDTRSVGASKALAGTVGLKDMRAISATDLKSLIGRSREEASPLSLPHALTSHALVIASETLTNATVCLPSPSAPTQSVVLSPNGWAQLLDALKAEGAAVRTVAFAEKGETTAPAQKAPAPKKDPVATKAAARDALEGQAGVQLGITVNKELAVFGDWYQQVLVKSDMLEYYDISGCYILKPWSYGIWQDIQTWFDAGIKKLGVENAYFPMFVSSRVLEREKDHIEGFAPEVAWVTRAGKSELEEPIAIRPTSETVMYPYYAKWIKSHRDLPLKYNQWNSVVRWEFKNPQPFLRTREFLWQEGHTAHLTKAEADTEVRQILDLYRRVYEDLLAVPMIPGVKTEKEKFAGGLYTTTIEGFIPTTGRGIQAATSHCLGQNFSRMFNISVENPDEEDKTDDGRVFVWQNSWGLSTRTIGVMVMVHGDDKGLVLPPRVAQLQVVVVPVGITAKTTPEARAKIESEARRITDELLSIGVKAKVDLREGYTPGFKFNHWEVKGVPIRLEIGPKDIEKESVLAARRDTGVKTSIPMSHLKNAIPELLETIQSDMFAKAKKTYDEHVSVVREWKDFVPTLNKNHVIGIPFCEQEACEDDIKDRSAKESASAVEDERAPSAGAKSLCIPFDQSRFPKLEEGAKCLACGKPAHRWTLFGRSY